MSAGIICDQCGASLVVNKNGEDEAGEIAAWLRLCTGEFQTRWDACSRSCAVELIEHGPVRDVLEAELEVISKIAMAIRGDHVQDLEDDET